MNIIVNYVDVSNICMDILDENRNETPDMTNDSYDFRPILNDNVDHMKLAMWSLKPRVTRSFGVANPG